MAFSVSRIAALVCVALAVAAPVAASAQSQDKDSKAAADAKTADQRKIDFYAEVSRSTTGPAANLECVRHGTTIVSLLWNEDIDTALRHLQLYDRFNCPNQHLQLAYRCSLHQPPNSKNADPLSVSPIMKLAGDCWMNPGSSSSPPTTSATTGPAPRAGSNSH
jgi:hypothetical protein